MNDQARAAVRGWEDTVNAAWEQLHAGMEPPAGFEPPPPLGRGLRTDEIEVARSVFGNELDTSQIRLTDDSPASPDAVALPNNIKFPPGALPPSDLNMPLDLKYRAWLVHELTHQWQYQHGRTVPGLALDAWGDDYDYGGEQGLIAADKQGKRFGEFNNEEQGDILRDYYNRRETGKDTSAYEPFVRQIHLGITDIDPYHPELPYPPGSGVV
jgi:hypothetical protein